MLSMTGYGKAQNEYFVVQIKSVNGKGTDVRLRGVGDLELEIDWMRRVKSVCTRGTVDITVQSVLGDGNGLPPPEVFAASVKVLNNWIDTVAQSGASCTFSDSWIIERALRARTDRSQMDSLLDLALEDLRADQLREGGILKNELARQIGEMRSILDSLVNQLPVERNETEQRLRARWEMWQENLGISESVPAEILAGLVKGDVQEEIVRLGAHLQQAETLLEENDQGRKLGVLGQELVREANTLTVKLQTEPAKRLGIDLKTLVEQFKEQAANVA